MWVVHGTRALSDLRSLSHPIQLAIESAVLLAFCNNGVLYALARVSGSFVRMLCLS